VVPLVLPPLCERADEIPALTAYFAGQIAAQNAWKERKFSAEALEILKQYSWPGNVRELRNLVERVLLLSASEIITAEEVNLALPASRSAEPGAAANNGTLTQRMEFFEREVLLGELRRQHHHMTNAARALGLERSHLYKKCQQLGIDLRAERKSD
jgi:two-component system nitrogen regulation response regulator NtrX